MTKEQITKREHYIAQVYLRGFSDNGKTVYAYNIQENTQYTKPFSINSICCEDYLYEYFDNKNQIIFINELERLLSKIESNYSRFLSILQRKVPHKENTQTNCFFSTEEKEFWKGYIAIQMLRLPDVINELTNKLRVISKESLSKNEARNAVLYDTISLYSSIDKERNSSFHTIMKLLDEASMCLFVDRSNSLFTTDKVISIKISEKIEGRLSLLFFPVMPDIAIVLYGKEYFDTYGKNKMYYFNEDELDLFKTGFASTVKWIYSKEPLSRQQIERICEVRKNAFLQHRIRNK